MIKSSPFNRRGIGALLTALPAVLIVFVCCGLPLLWMLVAVVLNPQVRGEVKLTDFRFMLLCRTLGYNGIAAVIATAMGLPAAFVLGRGRGWFARIMWVLLPAALLMPSLSYAYGWSQFVRIVWHYSVWPAGFFDIFRCIWSLAAWLWAVPAGLIGLALRRMDTNVQQQALLDGALYRITFRQLLGPIIASLAVVTVLASQEFAVYEPTGISVVATELRMVFVTGAMSSPDNSITAPMQGTGGWRSLSPDQAGRAAACVAAALPLVVCTLALSMLAIWGIGRASAADSVAVGSWPASLDAPLWATATTFLLVGLNVGLPVWALIHSLHIKFSIPHMWDEFGPLATGAIVVAAIATAICLVVAFSSAGRWMPGLMAIAGLSFLIGGQLLAIGMIRIFNRILFPAFTHWIAITVSHLLPSPAAGIATSVLTTPFDLSWAYGYWPVPVMAYIGRFGWLALAGGRGTWSASWKELRDMASLDGAGVFRTALSVVWPLSWPTLTAGALLVGALSLTEVPATVLLSPSHPQVLTPLLMTWVHMARFDAMIEASLLMMMTVLVPALAAMVLISLGLRMAAWRGGRKFA